MKHSSNQKFFLIALALSILLHLFFLNNLKFNLLSDDLFEQKSDIQMTIMNILSDNKSKDIVEDIKEEELISEPLPIKELISKKVAKVIETKVTPKVVEKKIEEDFKTQEENVSQSNNDKETTTEIDIPEKTIKDEPKKINLDTSQLLSQISSLDLSSKKDNRSGSRVRQISSRTKDYEYRSYFEAWRQKVERIGALNYPKEAKLGNFGSLRLTVSINQDGAIHDIVVEKSSGSKALDEAAIRIVKLGEPYASFSDRMRHEVDILNITRTWKFTETNQLLSN
jgi:TonB family protein